MLPIYKCSDLIPDVRMNPNVKTCTKQNKKNHHWYCVSKSSSFQLQLRGLNLLKGSTFGNPGHLDSNFGWRQSARNEEMGKNQHNSSGNLPGESLYGFSRLHIPLGDVWIFSAGGRTCHLSGMVNRLRWRPRWPFLLLHRETFAAFVHVHLCSWKKYGQL